MHWPAPVHEVEDDRSPVLGTVEYRKGRGLDPQHWRA